MGRSSRRLAHRDWASDARVFTRRPFPSVRRAQRCERTEDLPHLQRRLPRERALLPKGRGGAALAERRDHGPCRFDHRRALSRAETARRRWNGTCLSRDRKSTRLNSSHTVISYAVFCLKKKKKRPDRSTSQAA